ncbi:MAG: nicotinate (nicotinamide) nucleotide adenylyltransferase [Oscillospiraceae bacterium]|nr:nicotinate (nicotinamide) nucleotide adenylyltransferase [Oscillospiraceae bacterium]
MRLGIYGGTFDPPHLGHLTALKAAVRELELERVLVIPTFIPPHKEQAAGMASCEDRLKMTELCFGDAPGAGIWDGEIKRGGRSYTIDTVTEIKKLYPDSEIVLLMGTDMYVTLEAWREFERLLGLVTCGVFIRNSGEEDTVRTHELRLREMYGAKTEIIPNDPVEISSTELRELLPKRQGREFLRDEVYEYIVNKGLFGVKADFDWLRCKAYDMLNERRIRHVAGCEAEAVKLAKAWGCDVELAREAAILHDITKKLDLEGQLNLCSEYGIIIDEIERSELKLLHSKTGAYVAKDRFNVCGEVFNAILWHTTGREDMSLLDKVIYLADYIEPTRDFEGVKSLRAKCYEDLDGALCLGLEMSIADMEQYGVRPHERTANALNWLRKGEHYDNTERDG